MSRRFLINLGLLFCIVGLAIFLTTNKDKEIVEEEITLTGIDPASIHVIQIERQGLDNIIFQKQDDHWDMQSPFNLPRHTVTTTSVQQIMISRHLCWRCLLFPLF
jgi:hypothetical protein